MAHINLLPWREELRKHKQKEFLTIAMGAVVVAALAVLLGHIRMENIIDGQHQRNAFLQNEIDILDQQIEEIKELESIKAGLLARMNIIQELQSSRPESVHLIDELVRTLPEGAFLDSFTQKDRDLKMTGMAESNARVSDYMRNIDTSEWLELPKLVSIISEPVDHNRVANFSLHGKQKGRQPAETIDSETTEGS